MISPSGISLSKKSELENITQKSPGRPELLELLPKFQNHLGLLYVSSPNFGKQEHLGSST